MALFSETLWWWKRFHDVTRHVCPSRSWLRMDTSRETPLTAGLWARGSSTGWWRPSVTVSRAHRLMRECSYRSSRYTRQQLAVFISDQPGFHSSGGDLLFFPPPFFFPTWNLERFSHVMLLNTCQPVISSQWWFAVLRASTHCYNSHLCSVTSSVRRTHWDNRIDAELTAGFLNWIWRLSWSFLQPNEWNAWCVI